jgi:hypothetical protein
MPPVLMGDQSTRRPSRRKSTEQKIHSMCLASGWVRELQDARRHRTFFQGFLNDSISAVENAVLDAGIKLGEGEVQTSR